jgi:hypothetical protein
MNNKLASVLVLAMVAMTGCTIETMDISAAPLAGTVDGQTWTFQVGHTDSFLSEGRDDFSASLYPTSFTTCGFSEPSGPHLIVAIPKLPGDYELGFGRNMTFVGADSHNLVAFDGRIVVDQVSATHVTGGLHGTYDFDNEVNGRFDVTVCPD